MKRYLLWAVGLAFVGSASAQDSGVAGCADAQTKLVSDQQKYQHDFQGLQDEGDEMKKDSVDLDVDVGWSDQTIIFNVPSITMKEQKIAFGVPQTTVVNQHMIFDIPSITMKLVKTGQYPETTCKDTWIKIGPLKTKGAPSCTVTWHDIFTKVPETTMQRNDIVLGVPRFTWKDTTFIAALPEFTSQEVKWIIGLPQFKVRSIAINYKKLESESNDLQNTMAAKKADMTKEVGNDIHGVFACYRSNVAIQQSQAESQFNAALMQLDSTIQNIRAGGADPANVQDQTGHTTNLVAQRADLARKRDEMLASFNTAAKQLDGSEKEAVASIMN